MIWPIKAGVTAATSARKENWQTTLPQKEMSSPFSSAERMYKHNATNSPTPAFCLFKPMHHKQRERDTLQTPLLHHAADTWLTTARHHYCSTTEYMQQSQLKERQTAYWLIKVTDIMQNLEETQRESEVKVMPETSQAVDWIRGKTDAGYTGSISIHSACWLTEGGGGRGGTWCTSGCRWLSFIPDHNVVELREYRTQRRSSQPHSSCRDWLTRKHTHTHTHDREITKVSPCRNPGLQWLSSRDPTWTISRLNPHSK